MNEVYDLKRAKKYFANNSKPVLCRRGNQEFIARYYTEAESFYRSDMKSPSQIILQKIIKLECDIEDCRGRINLAKNLSPAMAQQLVMLNKKTQDEIIENICIKIQDIQNEIDKLVEENPEVEPLYIMHIITK